jgi:hypothetical protein
VNEPGKLSPAATALSRKRTLFLHPDHLESGKPERNAGLYRGMRLVRSRYSVISGPLCQEVHKPDLAIKAMKKLENRLGQGSAKCVRISKKGSDFRFGIGTPRGWIIVGSGTRKWLSYNGGRLLWPH